MSSVTTFFRAHIGARIMAGFGLITLLALLVALVSLANVAAINRLLDDSAQRDRLVAANLLRLELAIEQQAGAVRGFLLSGDERDLTTFEEGAARFDRAVEELSRQVDHPESADRLANIRFQESRFRDVARQQIALYRQDWQRSAVYLWSVSGRERQTEVVRAIREYAVWQDEVVGQEVAAARDRSTLATLAALSLVGLAGLVSTMIALVLTRSITRPVRVLARVAGSMKGGDLDVRVPVVGVDEIGILAQTMAQMAASLKESRRSLEASLAETEQRNRELTALNTVARAAATLDRARLLDTTLATVLDLTGVEGGGIHLRAPDGTLVPTAQHGLAPALLQPETLGVITRNLETMVLTTGQPVVYCADEVGADDAFGSLLRATGLQSSISVPLTSQGVIVGVLSLGSQASHHFAGRDVEVLTSIGNQVGIAVENAALLDQRERRITTLSVINEIARAISAELDLHQLYAVIYEQCRRTLDMPGFTIALWDSKAEVLIPGLIYVDDQRVSTDGEWPFEPALLTIIAREHKTVLTDDYHATCRAYGIPGVRHVPPGERRSFLGVPMLISDRLVGVIVIATPNTTYSEEDRDLLVAIANQAGVAIENARLYQQTRELGVIEERNRLAREIHDTIAQGLTGIVLQLEAVDALLATRPERARQRLVTATELARNTLTEARRSVWNLRPKPLEERSLADSIAAETRRLADDGLVTRYAAQGEPGLVGPEVENAVYRIAQEALQNIRKHARATTVTVTLAWTAERLTLTIHDDGRGFDPDHLTQRRADSGGFGLLGMRERARLIGGRLDIHSAPGAGTMLTVEAPLAGAAGIPRPTQPASPTATRALIP